MELSDGFVGKEEMHLSGKGAAVLADGLKLAVGSGLCKLVAQGGGGGGVVRKDYVWTKG